MSDKKKDSHSTDDANNYPKNYWDTMNRLCALAMAVCMAFAWLPDIPVFLQELAAEYLYKVPLIWLALVGLPWLIKYGWAHREQLHNKWFAQRSKVQSTEIQGSSTSGWIERMKTVVTQAETPSFRENTGSLPPTLERLPVNPNPIPSGSLTAQHASDLITNALQLAEFSIEEEIKVLKIESGPVLQMITFQLPLKVQLSKLASKKEDIANHLGKQQGFDVKAAKDFKSAASFIIPHGQHERAFVYLRDLAVNLIEYSDRYTLPVVFGKDMYGKPIVHDLSNMPHLLVCGATGSGKSVFVNTLITSVTSVRSPKQVQLLLIDPKQVEFSIYKGLPHLLAPPVTDVKRSVMALTKIIVEMEKRYELFASSNTRKISSYNAKYPDKPLPWIIVFIDEYADLMMVAGAEVEDRVQRIVQKARAAGIHLILGTQRPSVDVVTGTIKSNLPSRVAFKLPGSRDYMTVLDRGAPPLLGYGDGVCMIQGGELERFQSAAISVVDGEDTAFIEHLIDYWRSQPNDESTTSWSEDIDDMDEEQLPWEEDESVFHEEDTEDPIETESGQKTTYDRALDIVRRDGGFSTATMQRELRISFAEAAALAEQMMSEEIIGAYDSATRWRPLLKQDDLIDKVKYYICKYRSTRTLEIRDHFGVRKEKVLECLHELVEEGMLNPPESSRAGYTIAWSEEEIEEYLNVTDKSIGSRFGSHQKV